MRKNPFVTPGMHQKSATPEMHHPTPEMRQRSETSKTHPKPIIKPENRDAINAPETDPHSRNAFSARNSHGANHKETRGPSGVGKSIIIENTQRRPILIDFYIIRRATKGPPRRNALC